MAKIAKESKTESKKEEFVVEKAAQKAVEAVEKTAKVAEPKTAKKTKATETVAQTVKVADLDGESVKNFLTERTGVTWKDARSNGNCCGKLKGKTMYIDFVAFGKTKDGMVLRYAPTLVSAEHIDGNIVQAYKTAPINGMWPACVAESSLESVEKLEQVANFLATLA